jgi:uncharacterized delta-60 repeat protein
MSKLPSEPVSDEFHSILRPAAVALAILLRITNCDLTAAPGDLDPTFGTAGSVTTDIGAGDFEEIDEPRSIALQSDGKIVVAGFTLRRSDQVRESVVVRYNANGSLDSSFGSSGIVVTTFGGTSSYSLSVAIQRDSKIIVAGATQIGATNDFALARYNANGTLDTSFSGDGKVTTAVGTGNDEAFSVALQADGKIVVAGTSASGASQRFAVARYTPNGEADATFGSGGRVITPVGVGGSGGTGVVIQTDGRIVVSGYASNGSNGDFAVVRYTATGFLDTSFGNGGKIMTDFGNSYDNGASVALQADGMIIVGGSSLNDPINGTFNFALARYTPAGVLDASFGSGGKVVTDFGTNDYGAGIAIQGDSKILLTGFASNHFSTCRYLADGSMDASFGTAGRVTSPIGHQSSAKCIAVQDDDKIVVAGTGGTGSVDFRVVRYIGGGAGGARHWPSSNGYAHPLSQTSGKIRSRSDAQFLSLDYDPDQGKRHVGIDITNTAGTADGDPVYAIDDGEIVSFRRQLQGTSQYPPGYFSVAYVRHFTAAGQPFWAVYGHCNVLDTIYPRPLGTPPTEVETYPGSPIPITKGRQIGTIIFPAGPHLHLGINTSPNISNFVGFPDAEHGWGRVPPGTTDNFIYNTLNWKVPIDQDSPVLLGWLNDPANTNNAPEQYTGWQSRTFAGTSVPTAAQAPTADADGDGVPNREEYALGLDPLSGNQASAPKVELIQSGGFTFPGFKHLRRRNATDLLYTIQTSDDMVNWNAAGAAVVPWGLPEPAPDGDSELVTFRLSPYGPAALKKFFNVLVSPAP